LLNLVFDYTAIHLVAEDTRKAFRSMWQSFRWLWTHLGRTAGLAAVLWVIMLALIAAYFGIAQAFPQRSVGAVLVLLLLRQVMVLGRIWSRLLFYASQCEMYDGLTGSPPPGPVPGTKLVFSTSGGDSHAD